MSRRIVDMVTAGILLIGLGYVVAVSSRTLPGQDGREPLLDVNFQLPDFVSTTFVWLMLALAAFGATFLLLSVTKAAPGRRPSLRRYLIVLVWIGILYLLYNAAGPAGSETASELSSDLPGPGESSPGELQGGAAWVVSILLVGVVAAALTRITMSIKAGEWALERPADDSVGMLPPRDLAAPLPSSPGVDPASRVITAYADFESAATEAGFARLASETPRHHATRAGQALSIDSDDLGLLSRIYSLARFGSETVEGGDADSAESAWGRLKRRLGR